MNVLVWNLENFGARFHNAINLRVTRVILVAETIRAANADVLVVQELCQRGAEDLQAICIHLGQGWHFDWVPGSITIDPGNNPVTWANLGFAVAGNTEGYGVVWNGNSLAQIPNAVSAGRDTLAGAAPSQNGNYINLIYSGAMPVINGVNPNNPDDATTIYNPNLPAITYDTNARAGGNPLGFPDRWAPNTLWGTMHGRARAQSVQQKVNVRRPCMVRLRFVPQGAQQAVTVDLVVYHAPNSAYSSYYGPLLALCADPLIQAPNTACVLAGDFNTNSINRQQEIAGWAANHAGLPNQTVNLTNGQQGYTMVSYINFIGTNWRNDLQNGIPTTYDQRDFGLASSGGGARQINLTIEDPRQLIPTVNIDVALTALLNPNSPGWQQIQQLTGITNNVPNQPQGTPATPLAVFTNAWNRAQFPLGSVTQETLLAEVYRLFFSDHLPIGLSIA